MRITIYHSRYAQTNNINILIHRYNLYYFYYIKLHGNFAE